MDPDLATQLNAECGIHSDPDLHLCLEGTVMYDTVKLSHRNMEYVRGVNILLELSTYLT